MSGWDEVIGHKQIVDHLKKAIETGKVGHSYIFSGEKGSGKLMLANTFARALQCTEETSRPCDVCANCRRALDRNHPDIKYVMHKKPASISVDEIREQLVEDVDIRPYSSQYKVYIVQEAEKMTPQAQNALLKTLEEPPEYVVILLLTSNEQYFLETIRSRCVLLSLKMVPDEQIKAYLMEEIHIPDYEAGICAAYAQGNVGKALRLASAEDFIRVKDSAMRLVKNISRMEIPEIIDVVREVQEFRVSVPDFLDLLALWYRDMIYFKATRDPSRVVFQDQLRSISETAKICSYEGVEEILKALETARERLAANVNFDLTMELLFLLIKENMHD